MAKTPDQNREASNAEEHQTEAHQTPEGANDPEAERLRDAERFRDEIVTLLQDRFGEAVIVEANVQKGMYLAPMLVIQSDMIADVARFLKDDPRTRFDFLNDLHGIDMKETLDVFYFLQSFTTGRFLALKVKVNRTTPHMPSVTPIWATADWQEREAYDLLGIIFDGHPNLKRILLTDEWEGHPLRKDYVPYDEGV